MNKDNNQKKMIQIDSRCVKEGDTFISLANDSNAVSYIEQAALKGANAIIAPKDLEGTIIQHENVNYQWVLSTRAAMKELLNMHFADSIKDIEIIGVTGTNGKTSIAYLLAKILSGFYVGTLGMGILANDNFKESQHTTPEALTIFKALEEEQAPITDLIMECSSHALAQERLAGIDVKTAIWTNLTHEHLDYHGSIENYFQAKAKLFLQTPITLAIINEDCAYGRRLVSLLENRNISVNSYSMKNKNADIFCEKYEMTRGGMVLSCFYQGMPFTLKTKLLGKFNIQNLMAVVLVFIDKGYSIEKVQKSLETLPAIPGRLESAYHEPLVFVDYAHTPDALKEALSAVREIPHQQIWCVFGCGGNRDFGKRRLMGEIAAKYADKLVITSDNPRNEDAMEIINGILEGVSQSSAKILENRREAIHFVLENANPKDLVLIAGKGHENYQIIGNKTIHFSDKEEVSTFFQN